MTDKRDKPISIADIGYEHQQLIEAMKSQLLIILLARLGGSADIPVEEVDKFPVGRGLSFSLNGRAFHFEVTEGPHVEMEIVRAGMEPGQTAYWAYGDSVDWKAYNGEQMPAWAALPPRIQNAWGAAARAMMRAYPDTDAAGDVLAERRRQQESEGWSAEHDDAHDGGELATAASAYALNAACLLNPHNGTPIDHPADLPMAWPWDDEWYKPALDFSDTARVRRDLVKAGALLLAEIERLDRMGGADARD